MQKQLLTALLSFSLVCTTDLLYGSEIQNFKELIEDYSSPASREVLTAFIKNSNDNSPIRFLLEQYVENLKKTTENSDRDFLKILQEQRKKKEPSSWLVPTKLRELPDKLSELKLPELTEKDRMAGYKLAQLFFAGTSGCALGIATSDRASKQKAGPLVATAVFMPVLLNDLIDSWHNGTLDTQTASWELIAALGGYFFCKGKIRS